MDTQRESNIGKLQVNSVELEGLIPDAHTLPTSLVPANRGAADFGIVQQLLAFGAQNVVVIFDTNEVRILQTLSGHKQAVVRVCWSRENYAKSFSSVVSPSDAANTYPLQLASADVSGTIIVWDVRSGALRSEFSQPNRGVLELCWLSQQDASRDLLLVLHTPNQLTLWNAESGVRIWTRHFTELGSSESFLSFAIDPFDERRCALLSDKSVWLIDDLCVSRPPGRTAQRLFVVDWPTTLSASSSTQSVASAGGQRKAGSPSPSPTVYIQDAGKKMTKSAIQRMSNLFVASQSTEQTDVGAGAATEGSADSSQPSSTTVSTVGCIQVLFSRFLRHQLVLVFPREVIIVDLLASVLVTTVTTERSGGSSFSRVYACANDDALFCLHEDATISYRKRRWPARASESAVVQERNDIETSSLAKPYMLVCTSEPLRQFNLPKAAYRLALLCINPINECDAVLVLPDGRALVWHLQTAATRSRESLVLSGIHMPVASNAYALRMCPPLTMRTMPTYKPQLALGTTNGRVQVVDLVQNTVISDLQVLSSSAPVRGIEWASSSVLICFGFVPVAESIGTASANASAASADLEPEMGKNELVYVDLQSQAYFGMRTTHTVAPLPPREPPIELVRVNASRNYLLVLIRGRAVELWSLHTLRCLYEVDCQQLPVLTLDWAPPKQRGVKERFILTDSSSSVRTVTVQHQAPPPNAPGGAGASTIAIREGRRVPLSDAPLVRTCALKDELVVFGTGDSLLQVWNYELRVFRNFSTAARISIRKLRFSPGRRNHRLLVLDSEGAHIEVHEITCDQQTTTVRCDLLGTLSFSRPQRCIDADWASSGTVVLTVSDHQPPTASSMSRAQPLLQLRLYDSTLTRINSELACGLRSDDALSLNPYALCSDKRKFPCSRVFALAHACLFEAAQCQSELSSLLPPDALALFLNPNTRLVDRYAFMLRNTMLIAGEFELQLTRLLAYRLRSDSVPLSFDVLLSMQDYHALEHERLRLHEKLLLNSGLASSHRALEEKQSELLSRLLLVSSSESSRLRSVLHRLLDLASPQRSDYLSNGYLACVLASERSSSDAQSCIKTVATNLIANQRVLDGVQLLCLIDKHTDACRYLLSHNEPDLALWLAKLCITDDDVYGDVCRRVADYFWNVAADANAKRKAVLLLVTVGDYERVLDWLLALKYFDVAYVFYRIVRQLNLIPSVSQLLKSTGTIGLVFSRLSTKLEYARILIAQQQQTRAVAILDGIDAALVRLVDSTSEDEQATANIVRFRVAVRELRG